MQDDQHQTEQWPSIAAPESSPGETQQQTPYKYYALLIGLYQLLFGLFLVLYRGKKDSLQQIGALDLTMLGLATLRVSKTISEDEISKVVRQPLVSDRDGLKAPRGQGLRWALGKLVLCPTCLGTWIAAFLSYSLYLFPRYTRPFLAVMAASGMEQFSDALLSLVYTDRNVLRKQEE